MTLSEFNFPGSLVIDAFLYYIEYNRYDILKKQLSVSNNYRYQYVQDVMDIYDIKGISIDKCKIIVTEESDYNANNNNIFILVAVPKEEYDANIKPINKRIFAYIGRQLKSKVTAFGNVSPISRKIFVKFIPNELCDIKSEQFNLMEYLDNVYQCLDFAIRATECTYSLFIPEWSSKIFTIVYFLQMFKTFDNKEVVRRLFCDVFDCCSVEGSKRLADKIFDLIGEDLNNHLKDYNTFYRFIYKLGNLIDEEW